MKLHQCSRRPEHARAVWFVRAMGLLDDAIRDHLELKRRRGADPAEVAREQREALDMEPEPVAEFEPGGVATDAMRAATADGDAARAEDPGTPAPGETEELALRT